MNPMKMNKEEYNKFRIVINVLVFIAFLAVFIFVEAKHIKNNTIIGNLVVTIILSSLLMMLGVMTIFPMFSSYFGITLIVFSILMFIGEIISLKFKSFNIFIVIEMILSAAAFLYGIELAKQKDAFISLKVMAADTNKIPKHGLKSKPKKR